MRSDSKSSVCSTVPVCRGRSYAPCDSRVFQQVKPFVFNLPARPTGCHNLGSIDFGDIKRGNEAKALRGVAVADPTNLKFNVIDLQRIVAVSDRQLPGKAILINLIGLFAIRCFFDHPRGWLGNAIEITEKCL